MDPCEELFSVEFIEAYQPFFEYARQVLQGTLFPDQRIRIEKESGCSRDFSLRLVTKYYSRAPRDGTTCAGPSTHQRIEELRSHIEEVETILRLEEATAHQKKDVRDIYRHSIFYLKTQQYDGSIPGVTKEDPTTLINALARRGAHREQAKELLCCLESLQR